MLQLKKKLNALHKKGKIRMKRSISRVVCLAVTEYHGICLIYKSKVLPGIEMKLGLCETKCQRNTLKDWLCCRGRGQKLHSKVYTLIWTVPVLRTWDLGYNSSLWNDFKYRNSNNNTNYKDFFFANPYFMCMRIDILINTNSIND